MRLLSGPPQLDATLKTGRLKFMPWVDQVPVGQRDDTIPKREALFRWVVEGVEQHYGVARPVTQIDPETRDLVRNPLCFLVMKGATCETLPTAIFCRKRRGFRRFRGFGRVALQAESRGFESLIAQLDGVPLIVGGSPFFVVFDGGSKTSGGGRAP